MSCFKSLLAVLALALPSVASAQFHPAFQVVDGQFSEIRDLIELENIPSSFSQYGAGICYAGVAASILQYAYCEREGLDCRSLSPENRISILDMSGYQPQSNSAPPNKAAYSSLSMDSGGNPHNAAIIAMKVGSVGNEACASLEKFFKPIIEKNRSEPVMNYLLSTLASTYQDYQENVYINLDDSCDECIVKASAGHAEGMFNLLSSYFDSHTDILDVLWSLTEEDIGLFYRDVMAQNNCFRSSEKVDLTGLSANFKYNFFPEVDISEMQDIRGETWNEIREILRSGSPLAHATVCLTQVPVRECPTGSQHNIAIFGSANACRPGTDDCRKILKVLNTWGDRWQEHHNGGWIDYEILSDYTIHGKHFLGYLAQMQ